MYAPLDNETIFKKVFTDIEIFQQFVKDMFNVDIKVGKIETEKKFTPPIAKIDIKLDIYAESEDHRFLIEIQKIDYDYNFNRFLNYFITLLIEQQKRGEKYEVPQTVLGVVVLTRPFKINQLNGEPIKESVMSIDFDPRNFQDERIKLWNHKLIFLNSTSSYNNPQTPQNYQDWLNLFRATIEKRINITINTENKAIEKALKLIDIDNLDPQTINDMKISESKKAMIALVEREGFKDAEKKYQPLLELERVAKEEAEKREAEAKQREVEAKQREVEAKQREAEQRRQKEEALLKIEKTILKLQQRGFSAQQIAEDMEISEEEVCKIFEKK